MTVIQLGSPGRKYIGASTDTKPTVAAPQGGGIPSAGSTYYAYDTGILYITYDGTNWVEKDTIVRLETSPTIDIGDVTLLAGTAEIGKLGAGTAIIGKVGVDITKTIQTELKAITAVAADVQSVSSILDLSGQIKQVTILIDHAKDHASASVGQGTEYVVQVSEKATGNDTWRALASFTAAITAPTVITTDAEEVAGQTVIEIGATTPVVGDILFFKNATIGSSEWGTVIAIAAGTTCTLQDGLTNTQAQGTYNTQGEQFVVTIDVSSVTRLRVVANNTKGTTNRAICWRCAAITEA